MAAANGNYNSLRAQWTTRFSNNLNALLGYTWSKSLDETSSIRGSVGADFSPQNALCPTTCEYGPSDFNIPQRFVASILYILPFGKGQRFLNHGGVVNQVVGGWQLSTITTLQSGGTVDTSSWDSGGTNFVSNATRLSCVPGVNPVLPEQQPERLVQPGGILQPRRRHVWHLRAQQPAGTVAGERRCFDREVFPARRKKDSGIPHGNVQRSQPCAVDRRRPVKLGQRLESDALCELRQDSQRLRTPCARSSSRSS